MLVLGRALPGAYVRTRPDVSGVQQPIARSEQAGERGPARQARVRQLGIREARRDRAESGEAVSEIIQGDVLSVLRARFADESVQCVVTSPPYWGLRDYGVEGQIGLEDTPESYVSKMVEVFRGREAARPARDWDRAQPELYRDGRAAVRARGAATVRR